jgi:chromosome segregation ATPase
LQSEIQNKCYADLNKLAAEIKAAEKRLKEVNAEIEEKTEIRDNKVAERADLEQFRDLLVARIEELLTKKGIRTEQWEVQKHEHDKATAVIQAAKQIMEGVFDNSFL